MEAKSLIWIGMVVGSLVGGALPALWGGGMLSMSSLVLSSVGAIAGIWVAFRISRGY